MLPVALEDGASLMVPVDRCLHPRPVGAIAMAVPSLAEIERKQCAYCREWIDPGASVCPFCRTDQGAIAAVQRATWTFVQLFLCFAALGVGVVVMVRLLQWGFLGHHLIAGAAGM
jgi:hypothetical protein